MLLMRQTGNQFTLFKMRTLRSDCQVAYPIQVASADVQETYTARCVTQVKETE